jgi:hypothetical protein
VAAEPLISSSDLWNEINAPLAARFVTHLMQFAY